MEKNKINVEVEASNPNIIIIDGKKYMQKKITTKKIGKTTHEDKILFQPMNEEAFEKDLNYVVDNIKNQTSTEELLKDLLKHTPPKILKGIAEKLKAGNKPKKQKGCLGFEIGGRYLEITP